jgi:rRNA-processing protein FCF1
VKDALIAATARDEADAIVTDDKTLRKRIRRQGLDVPLLTFEEFRRHVSSLKGDAAPKAGPPLTSW